MYLWKPNYTYGWNINVYHYSLKLYRNKQAIREWKYLQVA